MAENSKIEWTDATWNPVLGCDKISPGCKGCYAIRTAWRLQHNPNPKVAKAFEGLTVIHGGQPNWTGRVNFVEERLKEPLGWHKPRRVFVNSQSDLFHDEISFEQIDQVFAVMAMCKQHTFQILTKRPARALQYLKEIQDDDKDMHRWVGWACEISGSPCASHLIEEADWPLPNVWLGVSVENQQYADERIPLLLQTPAAVRWISAEPLLGPVSLEELPSVSGIGRYLDSLSNAGVDPGAIISTKLNWVVAGGESGPGARPMHPDWARSMRDQCRAAGVPFFFKQWGEWAPGECGTSLPNRTESVATHFADKWSYSTLTPKQSEETHRDDQPDVYRFGKKAAGRKLDGVEHNEYPLRPNQCNCSGSWHAIGSQGCTMEAASASA